MFAMRNPKWLGQAATILPLSLLTRKNNPLVAIQAFLDPRNARPDKSNFVR